MVGAIFQRDELARICGTEQLVDLLIGQIALAVGQGVCRNELPALESEEHAREIYDFDQAQTLVWSIKAESEAILGKVDDDGCLERGFVGEGKVDLGKSACVSLELGQDIKQRGAEDCDRGSDQVEVKRVCIGSHVPMKPSEWAARKGSDVGSAMIDR